jgi:hypothetical protein
LAQFATSDYALKAFFSRMRNRKNVKIGGISSIFKGLSVGSTLL